GLVMAKHLDQGGDLGHGLLPLKRGKRIASSGGLGQRDHVESDAEPSHLPRQVLEQSQRPGRSEGAHRPGQRGRRSRGRDGPDKDDATEGAVLHRGAGTLDQIESGPGAGEYVLQLHRFAGVTERRVQQDQEIRGQVDGCVIRLEACDSVTELAEALCEHWGQVAPTAEHQRVACSTAHLRPTLADGSGRTVSRAAGKTVRRAEWPPGEEAPISALSPWASAMARRSIVERTESA